MQDQPIEDRQDAYGWASEEEQDNTILNLLLGSQPWTVEEVAREVRSHSDATDSIGRLIDCGLVYHAGELLFPTRTARRAEQLQVGTV